MARRVAIIGIDGSGKSALVHRLRERLGSSPSHLVAFNSPRYHDTPNAPLARLSAQLKALSDVADRLESFELKLAALYLRMTLYGPVERFFEETFAPAHIVSDRHALVDTLAYVPLYQRKVASKLDGDALEPVVLGMLEASSAGAYDAARAWHDLENRRLGRETDFWALAGDVVDAFARPPETVVAEFERRYRTTLPDVVVLLDVDPHEAARRSGDREAGGRELHETEDALATIRDTYELVFGQLAALRPDIELVRVGNSDRPLDETLEDLVAQVGLAVAPSP